jgi:hypothetical protein
MNLSAMREIYHGIERQKGFQIDPLPGSDTVLEFEVADGSHIYVRMEGGADAFFEWEDVPEQVRYIFGRNL